MRSLNVTVSVCIAHVTLCIKQLSFTLRGSSRATRGHPYVPPEQYRKNPCTKDTARNCVCACLKEAGSIVYGWPKDGKDGIKANVGGTYGQSYTPTIFGRASLDVSQQLVVPVFCRDVCTIHWRLNCAQHHRDPAPSIWHSAEAIAARTREYNYSP